MDLQITDPTVPSQLLDNANRWLRSFQDDPARNAVPYSVTLAPLTIAEGPLPPNTAETVEKYTGRARALCEKAQPSSGSDQFALASSLPIRVPMTGQATLRLHLPAWTHHLMALRSISILSRSAQAWPSTIQRTPLPRPNSPQTWDKSSCWNTAYSAAAQAHRSGRAANSANHRHCPRCIGRGRHPGASHSRKSWDCKF